ncbi:MAG: hypothetical protein ACYDD1_04780 [Caulobacteraceae bacterium]
MHHQHAAVLEQALIISKSLASSAPWQVACRAQDTRSKPWRQSAIRAARLAGPATLTVWVVFAPAR